MCNYRNKEKYLELYAGVNDLKKYMDEHHRNINVLTDEDVADIFNYARKMIEEIEKEGEKMVE